MDEYKWTVTYREPATSACDQQCLCLSWCVHPERGIERNMVWCLSLEDVEDGESLPNRCLLYNVISVGCILIILWICDWQLYIVIMFKTEVDKSSREPSLICFNEDECAEKNVPKCDVCSLNDGVCSRCLWLSVFIRRDAPTDVSGSRTQAFDRLRCTLMESELH